MSSSKTQIRESVIEELKKELLGPGSEGFSKDNLEEIIWETPSKRYSTGILYPMDMIMESEDEVSDEDVPEILDDEYIDNKNFSNHTKGEEPVIDNSIDEAMTLANQFKPSSMGLTFFIKGNRKKISISYSYGKYRAALRTEIKTKITEVQELELKSKVAMGNIVVTDGMVELITNLDKDDIKRLREQIKTIDDWPLKKTLNKIIDYRYAYKRIHTSNDKLEFKFEDNRVTSDYKDEHIRIFVKRKYFSKIDRTSFTVVMINNSKVKCERNTIFQPKIIVSSDINDCKLGSYTSNSMLMDRMNEEEKRLELLFRNKKKYGVGHGVSVEYKKESERWQIETVFLPEHEVESMNFDSDNLSDEVLGMENLSSISSLTDIEITENLAILADSYGEWMEKRSDEVDLLESEHEESAKENIKKAYKVLSRIRLGIEILKENENAMRAFKDANLAMLMQRVQGANRRKNVFPEDKLEVINVYKGTKIQMAKWRAFQLAFFLMSIEGIVNEESENRDTVDLIWVPTGGGKTEAYLALTAFSIFYRRLRNLEESKGTAVIMRYTLRLLAAQQFLRATSLICACELIRKKNKRLYGSEEITVGLWIGSNVTPNTKKEAIRHYDKLVEKTSQNNIDEHYKFQLLECPWCGTKLVKEKVGAHWKGQYGLRSSKKELIHKCTNSNCDFFRKLPVSVVDDYIYENPPTLLFATVDKFASMPWKSDISKIFASDDDVTSAPELIIQDELHLISGPLGTIVGLYESVIDYLCSHKGRRPKIIASTATIRNAEEQVKNLYNRDVSQFPPPVLDIDDSYFIKANDSEEKFGRRYIGIMGAGKTQTTVEVRLMGKLMQVINDLDCDEEAKDAYWTLVGYFNSIRELGKCTTLVSDDIKDFMRRLSNRSGEKLRYIYQADELTSRVSSSDILRTLDKLEKKFRYDNKENKIYTSDIVLATNMISVGVDVSRLNSMVVVGQPKLTAEYIQASSRVGRKDPGLVCTLYDSAKTRDRSHYENFKSYHDSFYYYVEPTSLTPFSEAAVDRALHALIITLMRHLYGYSNEDSASEFEINGKYVEEIKEILLKRVMSIDPDVAKVVGNKIDEFFDFWQSKITALNEGQKLNYSVKGKENQDERLIKDYAQSKGEYAYETLRAMRNVDTETKVHIRRLQNE